MAVINRNKSKNYRPVIVKRVIAVTRVRSNTSPNIGGQYLPGSGIKTRIRGFFSRTIGSTNPSTKRVKSYKMPKAGYSMKMLMRIRKTK